MLHLLSILFFIFFCSHFCFAVELLLLLSSFECLHYSYQNPFFLSTFHLLVRPSFPFPFSSLSPSPALFPFPLIPLPHRPPRSPLPSTPTTPLPSFTPPPHTATVPKPATLIALLSFEGEGRTPILPDCDQWDKDDRENERTHIHCIATHT